MARAGKTKEAIACTEKAVELDPNAAVFHKQLAALLASEAPLARGNCTIGMRRRIIAESPCLPEKPRLAAGYDRSGQQAQSGPRLSLAEGVAQTVPSPDDYILDVLAAAYAANGRFADAVTVASRAREIALAQGRDQQAAEIGGRIRLYQAGKPYRQ